MPHGLQTMYIAVSWHHSGGKAIIALTGGERCLVSVRPTHQSASHLPESPAVCLEVAIPHRSWQDYAT